MNLANLIAPEWVQEGCPARFKPQRPANAPAPGPVVTRDSDRKNVERVVVRPPIRRDTGQASTPLPRWRQRPRGSLRRRILDHLATLADDKANAASEISEALVDVGLGSVCAVLSSMFVDTLVTKAGESGAFRWRITAKGREALRTMEVAL